MRLVKDNNNNRKVPKPLQGLFCVQESELGQHSTKPAPRQVVLPAKSLISKVLKCQLREPGIAPDGGCLLCVPNDG